MNIDTNRRQGFILIIIIAMLGVLGVLAVQFASTSQTAQKLSGEHIAKAKSRLAARSGAQWAIQTSIERFGTGDISCQTNQKLDAETFFQVRFDDTSGKININDGILAGETELGAAYEPDQINPWVGGTTPGTIHATGTQLVEGNGFGPARRRCNIFDGDITGLIQPGDFIIVHSGPNDGIEYQIQTFSWNGSSTVITIAEAAFTNGPANRPWTIRMANNYSASYNASGWNNLRLRRLLNAYGDVHKFVEDMGSWPGCRDGDTDPFTGTAFAYSSTDGGDRGIAMNARDSSGNEITDPADIIANSTGLGDRIIQARPTGGYKDLEEIRSIVDDWGDDVLGRLNFFDEIQSDLTVKSHVDDSFYRMTREIGEYANRDHPTLAGERMFDPFHPVFTPTWLDADPPDFTGLFASHPLCPINLRAASRHVRAALFFAPCNVSLLCESAQRIKTDGAYTEANSPRQAIGVTGLQVGWESFQENGYPTAPFSPNRPPVTNVQVNRFMSLRDALSLSLAWESYVAETGVALPSNFEEFRGFLTWFETWGREYERALPKGTPFHTGYQAGIGVGANTLFVQTNPWDAGFTQDYVSAMLPELLSPIRRIPGYLGAPAALVSPTFARMNSNMHNVDYWSPGPAIGQLIFIPQTPIGPAEESVFFGSYKPEDFVFRSHLPKVMFQPSDNMRLDSIGVADLTGAQLILAVPDPTKNQVSSRIRSDVRLFELLTHRSQSDFNQIVDSADTEILIGPEHPNQQASPNLGFIGLRDREDPAIGSPQIVMSFTDGDFSEGFSGSGGSYFPPSTAETDPAIQLGVPINNGLRALMYDAMPEDADRPLLTKGGSLTSISPFGGFLATQFGHGHRAAADPTGNGTESLRFNDSLYFSLGDQVNPPGSARPFTPGQYVHNSFGQGLVTAWVRLPTTYTSCNDWALVGNQDYFMHAIAQIRLYDNYRFNAGAGTFILPVTITLGAGYDPEDEQFFIAAYYDEARTAGGYAGYNTLLPVPFDNNEEVPPVVAGSRQFMGIGNVPSAYKNNSGSWRLRRVVRLNKSPECGEGSWHRVTMGWDTSYNNLGDSGFWLKLRDVSNVDTTESSDSFFPGNNGLDTKYPHFVMSVGETIHSLDSFGVPLFSPCHRASTVIDNFQAVFGNIPGSHRGGSAGAYASSAFASDPTRRYDITSGNEPALTVAPGASAGSRLLHVRVRDYRPPDSDGNHPACDMEAGTGSTFTALAPLSMSENEQDAFYDHKLTEDLKVRMTWAHHKPDLDGDISTFGTLVNGVADSWTEIPWVKEIQVRYVPAGGPAFLNWRED